MNYLKTLSFIVNLLYKYDDEKNIKRKTQKARKKERKKELKKERKDNATKGQRPRTRIIFT